LVGDSEHTANHDQEEAQLFVDQEILYYADLEIQREQQEREEPSDYPVMDYYSPVHSPDYYISD
jgi:hypothetical protein